MEKYVKSVIWLFSASAIGYGCLLLTQSQNNVNDKYTEVDKSEVENNKRQFMTVLQAAANTNQPIHRLNKKELDALLKNECNARKV